MIPEEMVEVTYRCPKCDVLRGICSVANYEGKNGLDQTVINLKCTKCKSPIGVVKVLTPSPVVEKKPRKKKSMSVGVGELTEPKKV